MSSRITFKVGIDDEDYIKSNNQNCYVFRDIASSFIKFKIKQSFVKPNVK